MKFEFAFRTIETILPGAHLDNIELDMKVMEVKKIYIKHIYPNKTDEQIQKHADAMRFYPPHECGYDEYYSDDKTLRECGYSHNVSELPWNIITVLWRG